MLPDHLELSWQGVAACLVALIAFGGWLTAMYRQGVRLDGKIEAMTDLVGRVERQFESWRDEDRQEKSKLWAELGSAREETTKLRIDLARLQERRT